MRPLKERCCRVGRGARFDRRESGHRCKARVCRKGSCRSRGFRSVAKGYWWRFRVRFLIHCLGSTNKGLNGTEC
jgi:hypothetical protein